MSAFSVQQRYSVRVIETATVGFPKRSSHATLWSLENVSSVLWQFQLFHHSRCRLSGGDLNFVRVPPAARSRGPHKLRQCLTELGSSCRSKQITFRLLCRWGYR